MRISISWTRQRGYYKLFWAPED